MNGTKLRKGQDGTKLVKGKVQRGSTSNTGLPQRRKMMVTHLTAPWIVFLGVSGFCWEIFSTSTLYRIPSGVLDDNGTSELLNFLS